MPAPGPVFEPVRPPTPEELIAFRKRCKLTQKSMATFLGLGYSQYRNLEKGRSTASPIVSRVICWVEGGWRPPEFVALNVRLQPVVREGD